MSENSEKIKQNTFNKEELKNIENELKNVFNNLCSEEYKKNDTSIIVNDLNNLLSLYQKMKHELS
jgi:hypothetical protein